MFNNTLTLANVGGPTHDLSITDTDNGVTTRSINLGGGNSINLTVARTESTENKGVISDRYLVRVDQILTETVSPYAPTKLSAYANLVVPRRPDVTPELVDQTAGFLLCFLFGGTPIATSVISPTIARLLSGET